MTYLNDGSLTNQGSVQPSHRWGVAGLWAVLLLLCMWRPQPAIAQEMAIDEFTADQAELSLASPGDVGMTAGSTAVGADILGGERDIEIELLSAAINPNGVSAGVASGALSYSQDPTVSAAGNLHWDGADGDSATLDATGLGGLDITGNQDAIVFGILFDDTPISIDLEVYTDAANYSSVSLALPGSLFTATEFVVPYSAFTTTAGSGADFSNVGAFNANLGSVTAPDFVLDFIRTTSLLGATKTDALLIDNNSNGMLNPGDTLRYTVVVDNQDDAFDADATGVTFSSSVDPATSLVVGSVTTSQGTVTTGNTAGDTAVAVDLGTVVDGTSVTITLDVTLNSPLAVGLTVISCQGRIDSDTVTNLPTDDPDDPTGGSKGDGDPTQTPVFGIPLVESTKTAVLLVDGDSDGNVDPGDVVRYTTLITNTGNRDAGIVGFSSSVDANTALVVGSVTTSLGTVTTGNTAGDTTVAVDLGTLAGDGGSATITFDVTVDNPLPAGVTEISCQGTVDGSNFPSEPTDDPGTPPDDDPTVLPVASAPLIEVDKADLLQVDVGSDGLLDPGDTLRYTVVVTNSGDQDAVTASFATAAVANTTLVVGSVTTSQGTVITGNTGGDTTVAVDLGTLAGAGGSATLTFDVILDAPLPADVTQISCQGTVSGGNFPTEPSNDPDTGPDDDPTVTPINAAPEVEVDKADALLIDLGSNSLLDPGDTVRYTVVVTNSGDQDASKVAFASAVDINTTLVVGSVTTSQGTVTTGNTAGDIAVAVDLGTLAGDGGSATLTFDVTLDAPLPADVTQISCQGTVSGGNFPTEPSNDPDTGPDDDPTITPINAAPEVEVDKADALLIDLDSNSLLDPGDTLRYTVVVTNSGDQDAVLASFTTAAVANTTLVAGSVTTSQGTVTTGNTAGDTAVAVDLGTLAGAGGSATLTFDVTLNAPLPADVTQISCQGTVSGGNFPTEPSNDPDTGPDDDPTVTPINAAPEVEVDKADSLLIDLDSNSLLDPGDTVRYTVTVTNSGGQDASKVTFASAVDANTTLVVGSVTTSQGTVTSGNTAGDTVVAVELGTLAGGGGSVTLTFDATLDDPLPDGVAQISCQGTISGGNFPTEPSNDPDTGPDDDPTLTPVGFEPLLEAIKLSTLSDDADNSDTVTPGDQLEYTVVLTNVGLADALNTVFDDTPDANTTLVAGSATTTQGTITSGNTAGDTSLSVAIGTLAQAGGNVTITFLVTINNPLPDGVTQVANQGVVSGDGTPGTPTDDPDDPTSDQDPTIDIIGQPPVVEIPTLDQWGLLLMLLGLAGLALRRLRA